MTDALEETLRKARQLEDTGDLEGTKRLLNAGVSEHAQRGLAWAELTRFTANYENIGKALEIAEQALRRAPRSHEAAASLAYTFGLAVAENNTVSDECLDFVKQRAKFHNSPELLACYSTLLIAATKFDRAKDVALEAVTQAPDSVATNLAAAKVYFSFGEYRQSYQHVFCALKLDPAHAWHRLVTEFSGPLSRILDTTGKVDELADWLDQRTERHPSMILLTPRHTPWHSMTYARMREASIEKGLPSCLFVPMAKSGSISVGAILNSGFSLVSMTYGLINQRVIPSWAREYNKGGACHATHLIGTDENVSRLIDAGITKAIVHVRDPRQVILSLVHHKVKYERTFDEVRKYSYVDMPLPEKVDFVFQNN